MDGIKINKPLKKKRHVFKEMWQAREDYLFMLPFLALFFIFTVLPVVISIFLSFTYLTFSNLQHLTVYKTISSFSSMMTCL